MVPQKCCLDMLEAMPHSSAQVNFPNSGQNTWDHLIAKLTEQEGFPRKFGDFL